MKMSLSSGRFLLATQSYENVNFVDIGNIIILGYNIGNESWIETFLEKNPTSN